MMRMFLLVFLFISFVSGGPNDTVDQLKAAVSNVPYADQVTGGEVITVKGSVPAWLSGRASSQYLCPTDYRNYCSQDHLPDTLAGHSGRRGPPRNPC